MILSLEFERFRKFLLAHPNSALIIAARIVHMLRHAETALVELQRAQRIGNRRARCPNYTTGERPPSTLIAQPVT